MASVGRDLKRGVTSSSIVSPTQKTDLLYATSAKSRSTVESHLQGMRRFTTRSLSAAQLAGVVSVRAPPFSTMLLQVPAANLLAVQKTGPAPEGVDHPTQAAVKWEAVETGLEFQTMGQQLQMTSMQRIILEIATRTSHPTTVGLKTTGDHNPHLFTLQRVR